MPRTTNKNGSKGRPRSKAKDTGRASPRELAAMRAYLRATGEPVPAARIEAMLDEWKEAARPRAAR